VCTAPFGITGATVVGSSLILIVADRADSKALSGEEAAKLSATVARLIRDVK
jgi:hypothetical protein